MNIPVDEIIQTMRRNSFRRGLIALIVMFLLGTVFGSLLFGVPGYRVAQERDALRVMVTALREGGDGSCAVKNNGPHIVCWMEDGQIKLAMAPMKVAGKWKGKKKTSP